MGILSQPKVDTNLMWSQKCRMMQWVNPQINKSTSNITFHCLHVNTFYFLPKLTLYYLVTYVNLC